MFYNLCFLDAIWYGFILFVAFSWIALIKCVTPNDFPYTVKVDKGYKVICQVWDNDIGGYRLCKETIPTSILTYLNLHADIYEYGGYRYEKVVIA